MDPISEFDIRDSFNAMDYERRGRISMEAFKIVYLGLGFPRSGYDNITEQVLKIQDNIDDGLTFETVKATLSKLSTDRNHEISRDFSLIDINGDRSISWEDIVVLSEGAGDKVSGEVAKTMVLHASKKGIISEDTFAELFQPHKL